MEIWQFQKIPFNVDPLVIAYVSVTSVCWVNENHLQILLTQGVVTKTWIWTHCSVKAKADLPVALKRPGFCSGFSHWHSESLDSCVPRAQRVFLGTGNVMGFSSHHSHFVTLLLQFWKGKGMIFTVWRLIWSIESPPAPQGSHGWEWIVDALFGSDWSSRWDQPLWLCHVTSVETTSLSCPPAASSLSFILHPWDLQLSCLLGQPHCSPFVRWWVGLRSHDSIAVISISSNDHHLFCSVQHSWELNAGPRTNSLSLSLPTLCHIPLHGPDHHAHYT